MNVNKLVPGLKHVDVEFDDGVVCGVLIVQCKETKKMYVGYRSNLYAAVNSISSALRNGRHPNKPLQAAYQNATLEFYTFPTDTVGEALDLRNSIIDEHAKKDVFFNIYGASHVARVTKQLARYSGRKTSGVLVNGVFYETRKAAAVHFGITESTVSYRIKSEAYPDWKASA